MIIFPDLDLDRVPAHVACVMDGNGRWAQQRGLKRTDGHAAGEEALLDTVRAASDLGIEWLTVYAFSTENWKRPATEVRFLMKLNESILVRHIDELDEKNVRIRVLGRRDRRVPRRLAREMDRAVARTANNRGLTLTFAFNYGGRAELVDAVKRMIDDGVRSSAVSEKQISRYLYHPDMPDPDLVIRTSGEYRISNFLLWELAYSELVFTDVLWPDFDGTELARSILAFQQRDRRFGGIKTEAVMTDEPTGLVAPVPIAGR
ncbi:MAG: isoprenyl transferase [Actinobacteria bacterium]|nr:isoprenyl transferase [Actinomycetota bacterium]